MEVLESNTFLFQHLAASAAAFDTQIVLCPKYHYVSQQDINSASGHVPPQKYI